MHWLETESETCPCHAMAKFHTQGQPQLHQPCWRASQAAQGKARQDSTLASTSFLKLLHRKGQTFVFWIITLPHNFNYSIVYMIQETLVSFPWKNCAFPCNDVSNILSGICDWTAKWALLIFAHGIYLCSHDEIILPTASTKVGICGFSNKILGAEYNVSYHSAFTCPREVYRTELNSTESRNNLEMKYINRWVQCCKVSFLNRLAYTKDLIFCRTDASQTKAPFGQTT